MTLMYVLCFVLGICLMWFVAANIDDWMDKAGKWLEDLMDQHPPT